MSVDIVSGERHKTNVLTYIFRCVMDQIKRQRFRPGTFSAIRNGFTDCAMMECDLTRACVLFLFLRRSTVGEFADTCPVPKRATALPDAADGHTHSHSHVAGSHYGGHGGGAHGGSASSAVTHRIPEVRCVACYFAARTAVSHEWCGEAVARACVSSRSCCPAYVDVVWCTFLHASVQVMPKDYHQIVLYLEGKRALDQIYRG
jgi:hypothetical protein